MGKTLRLAPAPSRPPALVPPCPVGGGVGLVRIKLAISTIFPEEKVSQESILACWATIALKKRDPGVEFTLVSVSAPILAAVSNAPRPTATDAVCSTPPLLTVTSHQVNLLF